MGLVMYGPRHKINSTKATINKERHNFIIGIQNKIVRVNITIQLKQLQTEIILSPTIVLYISHLICIFTKKCAYKRISVFALFGFAVHYPISEVTRSLSALMVI